MASLGEVDSWRRSLLRRSGKLLATRAVPPCAGWPAPRKEVANQGDKEGGASWTGVMKTAVASPGARVYEVHAICAS